MMQPLDEYKPEVEQEVELNQLLARFEDEHDLLFTLLKGKVMEEIMHN